MSENLLIWLFGIIGAWLVILSGGVLRLLIGQARIETMMSMKSRAASKILHSPDNHLGIDDLLTKHHEGTITQKEWLELKAACEHIASNPGVSKVERWLANTILNDPKNGVASSSK